MRTMNTAVALAVGIALSGGCGGEGTPTTTTDPIAVYVPPVAPNTSLNTVMIGLVDHAAHHIWDLDKAGMAPPESEESWEEVTHYAIQIIAAGSYITLGGTGEFDAIWVEQTGWQAYAQDMTDAGAAALDAAINRNVAGVLAAGDDLLASCEGCHAEYKPGLPTEGSLHPRSH